MLSG
ncbi:Protein of unknown function [Propionibacterium freudenreichii subsp. freudenreichii]|jgi:hypothetical protein